MISPRQDRHDITIEQIKEKIGLSLKEKKDLVGKLELIKNGNTVGNKDFISLSLKPKRPFKEKFINYGLRYKNTIKKIPLLGSFSKKFYHALLNELETNKDTIPSGKRIKNSVRKIPVLGYLIWWIYMIVKTPLKITGLASELDGLKNRNETLRLNLTGLASELDGLKNRLEAKKVCTDWAEFYSKEITKEDMEGNINHHRYFIDLIFDWANKISNTRTPKLIEIGIGTATMSIYLSKRFFEVIGLDSDPLIVAQAIETNKKLGGHANFIRIDALDLQKFFKENTFDIAFSQGTMEHFDNNALKKILEAQLAVAKHVIFSVPSVNWPKEDFGDERKMTVEEWEKLLKDFGLKIEYISYYQEDDLHIAVVITSGDK